MVRQIPFSLGDLYIKKKLHPDTISAILKDGGKYRVFRTMYDIANDVNTRQDFLEVSKGSGYLVTAAITTVTALRGDAKEQLRNLTLKNYSEPSPHYRMRVIFTDISNGETAFNFEYRTSNQSEVYDKVPKLVKKINKLIWKKD